MSKQKTAEQCRHEFLDQVKVISEYWGSLEDKTKKEACDGVAFSILSLIDGCSQFPALDLSLSPHEDDKQYCIDNDEDWYEKGMMINDCMLHELYCKK